MKKRILLFVIIELVLYSNMSSYQQIEKNTQYTQANTTDTVKIKRVLSYFGGYWTRPFENIEFNNGLYELFELPTQIYGGFTKCVENYLNDSNVEIFGKKLAEGIYDGNGYLVKSYRFIPFLFFWQKKVLYSSYKYDKNGEIIEALLYAPKGIIIDSYLKNTLTNEIERNSYYKEDGEKLYFFKYDKRGKILKQIDYFNTSPKEKLFYYDSSGNESELKFVVANDTISCKFEVVYDENNNLIEVSQKSFWGIIDFKKQFLYDVHRRKIRELNYFYTSTGFILSKADTFIYNDRGFLTEFGPRRYSNERTVRKYDGLGNKIYEEDKSNQFTYEYDSNNNLIREIKTWKADNEQEKTEFIYDNYNNIIEKSFISDYYRRKFKYRYSR